MDNKITDWSFHFDGVFHNVNQEEIFNAVGKDVVDRTLDGYNGLFDCEKTFERVLLLQEQSCVMDKQVQERLIQ